VAGTAAAVEAAVDDHHRDAANLAPRNVVDRANVTARAMAVLAWAEVVEEAVAMAVVGIMAMAGQ